MKKTAFATAILLAAPMLSVMAAETANAAPPSCLKVTKYTKVNKWQPDQKRVKVTNNCSSTKKFKIDWNNAVDSKCITLAKGKTVDEGPNHRVNTSFNRLKDC